MSGGGGDVEEVVLVVMVAARHLLEADLLRRDQVGVVVLPSRAHVRQLLRQRNHFQLEHKLHGQECRIFGMVLQTDEVRRRSVVQRNVHRIDADVLVAVAKFLGESLEPIIGFAQEELFRGDVGIAD